MSTKSAGFAHMFKKASLSLNSSCHYFSIFAWKKKVLIIFIAKFGKHIKMKIDLFQERYF